MYMSAWDVATMKKAWPSRLSRHLEGMRLDLHEVGCLLVVIFNAAGRPRVHPIYNFP